MNAAEQAKLDEFMTYTRERFPEQVVYQRPDGPVQFVGIVPAAAFAPTGDRYVEFPSRETMLVELANRENPDYRVTFEECLAAMRQAFDEYTAPLRGTLYWRVRPEMEQYNPHGWRYYMRFLVSDKPAKKD